VRQAVLRAVLAESWRRPGRQLLIGLVVAVATAFAAASLMLTDSARSAIVRELAGTPQAAALVVSAPGAVEGAGTAGGAQQAGAAGVPADVQDRVRATQGVAAVAAFGAGGVLLSAPGAPGDGEPWTAMTAVDGPLARFPVLAGRLPTEANEAAVSEETARRHDLQPGGTVTLVGTDGEPTAFTVSGVAKVRLQAVDTALLRPDVVARMTGANPAQLDVLLTAGSTPAEVGPQVAAAVDGAAVVNDGTVVRSAELSSAFGSLDAIFAALAVFGGTAVLAAALTTSCAYASVAEGRRRTVVLLRRVGAGRGQVLRALLVDAGTIGLVAGLFGVGLSLAVVAAVRAGASGLLGQDLPAPTTSGLVLAGCVVGAALVTLAAAIGTVVRASGERPAAADESGTPPGRIGWRVARVVAAVVVAAGSVLAGSAAAGTADPTAALTLIAGSGVLAFGAVMAAGPVLLPGVAWLIGTLASPVIGLAGRLAVRSTRNAPNRASTTAAALVLASLLLSVVLVGLESMSTSVEGRIAAKFPAAVMAVSSGNASLPADLPQRLDALPETGHVAAVKQGVLQANNTKLTVSSVDPAAFPELSAGATDAGSLADLVPGTVALDRAQAAEWDVGVGDPLSFTARGKTTDLRVVAVYRSSGVLGPMTVSPPDLDLVVPGSKPPMREILVDPAAGTDVETLRTAVADAVGGDRGVLVQVPSDLREELDGTMQLTKTVAFALIAATVLVAVCGVAVAMALAIRERHRESTTLRALGLTPAQTVASIGVESTLLGLAGVLVGTGLGLLFGVLAVGMLQERPVVPAQTLALSAMALVLVAGLAGTLPAMAAARRSPVPSSLE
jgi:putative ABC transport system permease protein